MSRSTVVRSIAGTGVLALALVAPATAFADGHGHGHGHHAKPHASHKHHGKPAPARFTATGVFDATGSGTGTFTMDDKGGSKDLHGQQGLVITVSATTKVTLDDATSSLDQLVAGDHVTVNGTRGAGGELDAVHVNADSQPQPEQTSEAPDPTDSPSADAPDPVNSSSADAPQPDQSTTASSTAG